MTSGKLLPNNLFLPTERSDFNIPWDQNENWKRRHQKVMGTTAEAPLVMLALYWKYAWNTARSPWLMPELFGMMTNDRQAAVRAWAILIGDQKSMVETGHFVIGTQVLAYSGFYFAYEHFVVSCCEAKSGRILRQTIGYDAIKDAVTVAFSTKLEQEVWSHTDIERIRRIRNDLVHKSGVPKAKTLQMAPDVVIDGHLQITPNDIKEEMEILTAKVELLTNENYPPAPT